MSNGNGNGPINGDLRDAPAVIRWVLVLVKHGGMSAVLLLAMAWYAQVVIVPEAAARRAAMERVTAAIERIEGEACVKMRSFAEEVRKDHKEQTAEHREILGAIRPVKGNGG